MQEIVLGKEVRKIGADDFAGQEQLKRVTVLNPMARIEDGAFRGCGQVTICAHGGSFAEFYARKHGLPFEKL